ncbi:MAG: contractile injection system protein, VgrG/Pvc8 family, partial [Polyangiales bacterium]
MADTVQIDAHLTIDGDPYDLLWLDARELVDAIGVLRAELTDHEGGPDPAALVGKPAVVELMREDGSQTRTIAGYVAQAERETTRGDAETGTRIVVRPRLHRLTQRADCRVFQDMPAPDIVKKVLAGAGVPEDAQRWQLAGDYPKRTYVTQYRETDAAFVARLLSEEGISFTVDSSSGADVVVFFDRNLGAIDGDATL